MVMKGDSNSSSVNPNLFEKQGPVDLLVYPRVRVLTMAMSPPDPKAGRVTVDESTNSNLNYEIARKETHTD